MSRAVVERRKALLEIIRTVGPVGVAELQHFDEVSTLSQLRRDIAALANAEEIRAVDMTINIGLPNNAHVYEASSGSDHDSGDDRWLFRLLSAHALREHLEVFNFMRRHHPCVRPRDICWNFPGFGRCPEINQGRARTILRDLVTLRIAVMRIILADGPVPYTCLNDNDPTIAKLILAWEKIDALSRRGSGKC